MNKNLTKMRMKGSYQQQYIATMRRKTTMMRIATTVPGAHVLVAHIMIWMSLPEKEIEDPLEMKLMGR